MSKLAWKALGLPIAASALLYAVFLMCSARAADNDAQALFETPDKALAELTKVVQAKDTEALRKLFGPAFSEIANPDPVQGAHQLEVFAQHMSEGRKLIKKNDDTLVIAIGKEEWPFAIPLARKDGKWFFDTAAGKEEILNRRIGQDELSAIDVCRAYVQAQREYALKDCAGTGIMEYAQKIRSTPGKRDGLYWETPEGEALSPFGPLVAQAHAQGYGKHADDANEPKTREPFHGYFFKILSRQGKQAPGGKYNYVINDHMVAGFAFLAYPAQWGNSGVMTFIVNQQGKVFQKNLGANTVELAQKIEDYNPDETWTPVE